MRATLRAPHHLAVPSLGPRLQWLPLLLASFALLLQLTNRRSDREARRLSSIIVNEHEFGLPRLGGLPRAEPARVVVQQLRPAERQARQLPVKYKGLESEWQAEEPNPLGPKVAFVVTTSETLAQIKVWLAFHRAVGVSIFYIFVDGQAARPEVMAELRQLPGVQVVPKDEKLKRAHVNSRIWNETWLSAFFHKPCNHELFVVQSLNMEISIRMALRDKVDWLLHIDTDELILPSGSKGFSLQEVLAEVPPGVDALVFPNYESLPEREDINDPFTEVTLFKKNYQHVVPDLYFKNYHTVARGNPNYFITYGNGKSAARVQRGLRPNGAHRWHSYVKNPREESSEQAAVLHYTYNRFSDLKSRRDRCDCAPTEEDAKRCFILPFDRMAFLEASLKSDADLMQWFRDRLVWSDPAVVNDLLKKGLFARLYEPQLMIRGFMASMGITGGRQQPSVEPTLFGGSQQQQQQQQGGTGQGTQQQQAAQVATAAQQQVGQAITSAQQQQLQVDQGQQAAQVEQQRQQQLQQQAAA